MSRIAKPMSFFLIFSFLLLDFSAQPAWAALVGTEAAVTMARHQGERDRVAAFLGRTDVREAMVAQGVNPDEAMLRLDSLSQAELNRLSRALDQLPAGGDGLGVLVGAAVFIFVVLLITDILGLTHVFSFVNH